MQFDSVAVDYLKLPRPNSTSTLLRLILTWSLGLTCVQLIREKALAFLPSRQVQGPADPQIHQPKLVRDLCGCPKE